MSEQESQRESTGREGEDQEVESAAPPNEAKVVGEGAEVPAGKGEEANEAGVEGGKDSPESHGDPEENDQREQDDPDDERDEIAREIESDPASNPDDPMLEEIKGG